MSDPTPRRFPRLSRESRLLLVTVALCAVVLLLLARIRFPDAQPVAATQAPLERLAARATYDQLAADIQRVESRITPWLVVVRVAAPSGDVVRTVRDVLSPGRDSPPPRHVPALRVAPDVAIAALDGGMRVERVVDAKGGADAAPVIGEDPVRHLARVRVPAADVRPLASISLDGLPTPLYVVVVEGTRAGLTLRPVFLGRADRFRSPRWSQPLLPLGGVPVMPGALLFSLDGAFIGAAIVDNGTPAIVGARDLLDSANRVPAGAAGAPADPGFSVQTLTAGLASALGVAQGVVVADVDTGGPAAGVLQAADVITGLDGWSADDPDELLLRLASRAPGEEFALSFVRSGEPKTAMLVVGSPREGIETAEELSLTSEPRIGVRLDSVTAALRDAGLLPGDVVVRADGASAPTAPQFRRLLMEPAAEPHAMVLVVARGGRQRIVALPGTSGLDGAR
jgi:hypothetical protein